MLEDLDDAAVWFIQTMIAGTKISESMAECIVKLRLDRWFRRLGSIPVCGKTADNLSDGTNTGRIGVDIFEPMACAFGEETH